MDIERRAVYGLDSPSMPEGWIPLEAITVVKALDGDGDQRLCVRMTKGWVPWEALGAMDGTTEALRDDLKLLYKIQHPEDPDTDSDTDP